MVAETKLKVEALTKTFGEKVALNQLSFEMNKPGVFGLIGTNGAGKTTSIRCILGIMSADSGNATWEGKPITRESLSFGYMPEERGLYMKTKVLEQLVYFGQLRGMSKADAKEVALSYMERLQVTEYKDVIAEKLSKGNQQKIQLISTLIHDPKLIFLDEPFSGLDPVNTDMLRGLIEELVEEGRYIVMSSHQMSVVEDYCSDIVLLHNGIAVLKGDLAEIKSGYGHTNLEVETTSSVEDIAKAIGLELIQSRGRVFEYKIKGIQMAQKFLKAIVEADIDVIKYHIKEPSLHQIFLEKAGE